MRPPFPTVLSSRKCLPCPNTATRVWADVSSRTNVPNPVRPPDLHPMLVLLDERERLERHREFRKTVDKLVRKTLELYDAIESERFWNSQISR
jgi:hypothetical protein